MRGFLPDCGGAITRLAVSVIPQCFSDHAVGRALLHALGRFVPTLPEDVALVVLSSRESRSSVDRWVDELAPRCRVDHVDACFPQDDDTMALWTQDSFLVAGEGEIYFQPASENPTTHAAWLGSSLGIRVERRKFALAGGNMLVGPDFKLVGCESFPENPDRRAAMLAALDRIDDRRVVEVGYRLGEGAPSGPGAEFYRPRQYGGHIDRSISVTGLAREGRPLLVVARGMLACGADPASFGPIGDRLDRTAAALSAQGFAVLRNDVPFAPVLGTPQLRPRLYNNVLIENDVRPGRRRPLVWVPQFAEEEPALEAFDSSNRTLWEELGFEPVAAFGWSRLAAQMGALRCVTKVLGRG